MGEDDGGFPVSRRELLYGLGAAGLGAGTGAATAAVQIDRERFVGNLYATGRMDLERCWEAADASSACSPDDGTGDRIDLGTVNGDSRRGRGLIRLRLPADGSAGTDPNNPGYVWFRTPCPADSKGLEEKLCLRIWYDRNCNATKDPDEAVIASGTLCEVLTTLRDGVQLDPDPTTSDTQALTPGEDLCLGVEWVLNEPLRTDDSANIDFEFHAAQSRNHTPTNPWAGASCDVSCDKACSPKAISYVAFCAEGGFPSSDPITSINTAETNEDGEPIAVSWESSEPVDYVVIKNGGGPEQLYTFDVDGSTSGTTRLTVFDQSDPGSGQTTPSPCPDGSGGPKYEYKNDKWMKE